jgi:hypothetical protein
MASTKSNSQPQNYTRINNPVESGRHAQGFSSAFTNEIRDNAKALPNDFFSQLLGTGNYERSQTETSQNGADMAPGQEFNLPKATKRVELQQQERKPAIAAGNNYHAEIARSSEISSRRESQELKMQIQEITEELKRLLNSSDKVMQMVYADISVASTPTVVGKYHTNFFAFLLLVIQQARQKVEDSGAWLSVAKSKGGKKSYHAQSKKGGTSFTQSMDRSAVTSTG